jgi:Metallo-beta-lactamase superfamily
MILTSNSFVALLLLLFVFYRLISSKNIKSYTYGYLSLLINNVHSAYRMSHILHAAGRLFFDHKVPKGLPILTPYEKVSIRCHRISGLNPGSHTLQGTNTYLIGKGQDKILIDTGEDITSSKYVKFLFDSIFSMTDTISISAILLTHGHGDHQGGVISILNECKRRNLTIPKVYKCIIRNGHFPARGYECDHIEDGQVFKADSDCTIRAVYAPGHTDDHVAFILEVSICLLALYYCFNLLHV